MSHVTPRNARQLAREAALDAYEDDDPILPMTVYGPEVSYFTGKLEAALRFMELPYRVVPRGPAEMNPDTGVAQVPGLELADGRWLTDTTPILAWLDQRYPDRGVIPRDPVPAFFSRLLEDHADEWLWRPAMHYRWDYPEGAHHMSRALVDEIRPPIPLPDFVKRHLVRTRQQRLFTVGDGVSAQTWNHVEQIYLDTLAQLEAVFAARPFLLGDRPSLADFGFFGPMFRHFAMDPPSARIMRETAPGVLEWCSRVWNARASRTRGALLEHVPDDWGLILDTIGSQYLPHLCANAEAWKENRPTFDVELEGAPYRDLRTSRYRVWCLERLRHAFEEMKEQHRAEARERLEAHGCWEPLWRVEEPASGLAPKREAPFAGFGHSATGLPVREASRLRWRPVRIPRPPQ